MTSTQLFNEELRGFLFACLVVGFFLGGVVGVSLLVFFCLFLTATFSVISLDHFEGSYPCTL